MNTAKYFVHLTLVSLFSTCCNLTITATFADQLTPEPTQTTQKTQDISSEVSDIQNQKSTSVKKKSGLINKMIEAPRCPYGSTPIRKMTLQQLNEVYEYTQKHIVDLHLLSNILERLIALSDNHAGVKIYKLQYADAHFAMKHIDIAAVYYEDFSTLYPSSAEAEYALYKAVLCMFELSLEADRDQTNTKKTIALSKEFLKRSPKLEYEQEIQTVLTTCYNRLYDHEVYIFNFYIRKKNFKSARMRLDFITTTFEKLIQDIDKKVVALEQQLELAIHPVKVNKNALINKLLG